MQVLIADYKSSDAAEVLTQSLIETGFGVLTQAPIDRNLIQQTYQEWKDFFASDDKERYLFDKEKQDGFFPSNIAETAKGYDIKDLKEFYHYYPWGRLPAGMSNRTSELYQALCQLAAQLLTWIEDHTPNSIRYLFSMPLREMIENSQQSLLRILHYPPIQGPIPRGAVRAAAHEDINLITLLPAATEPGLEVQDILGNWHQIPYTPQSIIINVGDMLQMCTQGYYRSTTHRVINPPAEEAMKSRFSMPLFLHPRPEVRLSPQEATYVTAKSYLQERLRELGLKESAV